MGEMFVLQPYVVPFAILSLNPKYISQSLGGQPEDPGDQPEGLGGQPEGLEGHPVGLEAGRRVCRPAKGSGASQRVWGQPEGLGGQAKGLEASERVWKASCRV